MTSSASWLRDPEGRLRTVWRLGLFLLTVIVLYLGYSIALGVLVVIAFSAVYGGINDALIDRVSDWCNQYQHLLQVPLIAIQILVVFLFRRYLDRRPVCSVGLVRPEARPLASWPVGFWLGGLPVLLSAACLAVLGHLRVTQIDGSWNTIVLIPVLLLAAFTEEVVCRGYLLQNFLDIKRPMAGILFSSVLFWLFHSLNPSVWDSPWPGVNLFLAGVLLALAYLVSGNLWFPTALHFAWNFCQGVVLELRVSGIQMDGLIDVWVNKRAPQWLTGGDFGLEGSVLVTLVQGSMICFLLAVYVNQAHAQADDARAQGNDLCDEAGNL